jgi:hypothetical protein
MSKLLFLGTMLILIATMYFGNRSQKKSSYLALLLLVFFGFLYAILSPGLYSQNTSIELIKYSFDHRLNDVIGVLSKSNFSRNFVEQFINVSHNSDYAGKGVTTSGYSILLKNPPWVISSLVLLILIYRKGIRKIRIQSKYVSLKMITTVMVIVIYPFAFSIWGTQIYGFMVGFSIAPVFSFLRPRIGNKFFQSRNFVSAVEERR